MRTLQGPGISKERQARLFHPFEQAECSELKRSSEGTGVCSALMRALAMRMAGREWGAGGCGCGESARHSNS